MSEAKVTAAHLRRAAVVYVRQSTMAQLARNRESTTRQYDLVARAVELGWPRAAVKVIDEDLGMSGASTAGRSGFAELAAQVGLGQVGIVLALEVSRLARNNADWYRLLDLAGMTDTLIADTDGIYHPGLFNDRMLLGMKGTMSEAELHILRARLDGGIRSKAARGELRRGAAGRAGLGRGRRTDPLASRRGGHRRDRRGLRAVRGVRVGARGVAVAARPGSEVPAAAHTATSPAMRRSPGSPPTYHAVHNVLTHPAYAGAYTFGRTRAHRSVDADGQLRTGRHRLPQDEWEVLIKTIIAGSSTGTPTRPTRSRIARQHPPAGARARHRRGPRGLRAAAGPGHLRGVWSQARRLLRRPGQDHPRLLLHRHRQLVEGKGTRHLRVGGAAIDAAVAEAFLAALQPAALQACLAAAQQLEDGHDTALAQWRRQVEQARYEAESGRAPLPRRRPGQPPGRPRPGNRVEHRAARPRRRRGRTRPPRSGATENPDPTREIGHPRTRQRPP